MSIKYFSLKFWFIFFELIRKHGSVSLASTDTFIPRKGNSAVVYLFLYIRILYWAIKCIDKLDFHTASGHRFVSEELH
jgi:hypothetical protein